MASAEDTAPERPPGAPLSPGQEGPKSHPGEDATDTPKGPERIGFIGKTLGRFRITAELGRGGMATVYRARDPQLGRDVAVKVMHGFFAGRADIEARFRREANAVAAIRHPSILALYDFAPPAGEEPGYIVSELIEGHGLRQLIDARGGRLLPEVAVLITIRVAEALGAAHTAGIVHRDVKPDNVLIDRAGGAARVVLTDFGVAHVSGMDTMTATGAVLGSPAYMSPEQARGDDVGPTSDVFSLGVLLYQLCTGHLPFSGKDPLAVITAILRGDHLRPATIEARIGPELEQVITRCLAQNSAARFPNGVVVSTVLRGLLTSPDFSDENVSLRRFLADPDAFERDVSPGIARAAMTAAEGARRRGQTPRAIAEVGRALAYAPDDPAASEMLSRLGTRRRSRWIAAGIGVAIAGAAIAVTAGLFVTANGRDNTHPNVAVPNAGLMSASRTNVRPSGLSAPPIPAPPAVPPPAGTIVPPIESAGERSSVVAHVIPEARQRRVSRGTRDTVKTNGADQRMATTPSPAEAQAKPEPLVGAATGTADPTAAAPPEKPVREEKPAGEVTPEPATGSIVLRASQGFCEPSLDEHPPSLRASYNNLIPGRHEIFCTLPQGGGRVHVGTYNLRPGTRPSLIVVRGPNGRPSLGRRE